MYMNKKQNKLLRAMLRTCIELANTEGSCERCPMYKAFKECSASEVLDTGNLVPKNEAECKAKFTWVLGGSVTY